MKNQKTLWNSLYSKGLFWKKTNKIQENLKDKLVLELGVGNGKSLKAILEHNPKHVTAIDISEEGIDLVKKSINSENVSYITGDILKIKIKDKFDVIVCYYFLNNFKEKEKEKAVRNIISMLNKKGIILFEDFASGDLREKGKDIGNNTIEKQNGLICHFFNKEEVKKLFKGFNVKLIEREFNPIRKNKELQRKIISARIIRTR